MKNFQHPVIMKTVKGGFGDEGGVGKILEDGVDFLIWGLSLLRIIPQSKKLEMTEIRRRVGEILQKNCDTRFDME